MSIYDNLILHNSYAGDDGMTIDLTDIDGGTILLEDLTTLPEVGDFLV